MKRAAALSARASSRLTCGKQATVLLGRYGSHGSYGCKPMAQQRWLGTTSTTESSNEKKNPSLRDLPPEKVNDMLENSNIADLVTQACQIFADKPSLGTRVGDKYEWITYRQLGGRIQLLRNVLAKHKIGKNDKVALISNNREEWAVAMYAVVSLGAQLVPMYEAQLEKDWLFILKDSGSKMLLVGSEAVYEKTKGYVGTVGNVGSIICFDAPEDSPHSYKRLMKEAEKDAPVPPAKLTGEDHLVLIYTSGTTGNPKGVILNHENAMSVLRGLHALKGSLDDHTTLAFLPWAHVFGQNTELHAMVSSGSACGIVSNREQIVEGLHLVKPTLLFAVPMLLNKVYDGVMNGIAQQSPLRQKLVKYAFKVSRERNHLLEFHKPVPAFLEWKFNLFDKIIFSKIRERLGGNLRYIGSGGAAASMPVLHFFEDIGIPVCEGYGLTETAPIITSSAQGWENRRLGCVGTPVPGAEILILDPNTMEPAPDGVDGEICYAGPNVMVGYHNNPQANEEVFLYRNGKRFFRTGDMGHMVEGKFLKLTGRIKEQFKLENGKYVVAAPLEDHLIRSRYIAQAFMYGDNRPFTVALIVPDFVELHGWVTRGGLKLPLNDNAALIKTPEVIELLTNEVMETSKVMKSFERPRVWVGTHEAFTPDNHLLTPKMSLRRKNIMDVYGSLIEELYKGTAGTKVPQTHGGASE